MANVSAGYMGSASIGTAKVLFSSCSINPTQDILFYDHTQGIIENLDNQGMIFRPSVWGGAGSITFTLTEDSLDSVFAYVKSGDFFDTTIRYNCNSAGRKYKNCKINSFNFSCQAGDVATSTIDILAMDVEDDVGTSLGEIKKLLTWDKITVGEEKGIAGFNFKINNNANYIYTNNSNNPGTLGPTDIRLGIRKMDGSISYYVEKGDTFISTTAAQTTLSVSAGNFSTTLYIINKPSQFEGQVGPMICTVPFVGVGKMIS
jgi:hypothetical protein